MDLLTPNKCFQKFREFFCMTNPRCENKIFQCSLSFCPIGKDRENKCIKQFHGNVNRNTFDLRPFVQRKTNALLAFSLGKFKDFSKDPFASLFKPRYTNSATLVNTLPLRHKSSFQLTFLLKCIHFVFVVFTVIFHEMRSFSKTCNNFWSSSAAFHRISMSSA